ncbi:hypothetical protein Tco_1089476, partial [Tanacetum coccineum]
NDGRNTRRSYVQEEIIEVKNIQNDAGNIQRNLRTTSLGTAANVQCYNCSEKGPSYDYAFISEVQTPSTSYVNPLFAKDNQEQKYLKQPKIINNTIGDDQIDSNIIFDEPNGDVNSGSVEYDDNVQESYELEQLARNAYKEAEKQQIIAKKVQQQNIVLTKQLESYKEKVQNPKLYDASCLDDSKIHVNVRNTEDILDDATKSKIKMKKKSQDPIAIEKKQNVWTIDYKNLNALYEDFAPQKEFFAEQRYFSFSFISSEILQMQVDRLHLLRQDQMRHQCQVQIQ